MRRNIAEYFNRLSTAQEGYRRQTDDRRTSDSIIERERESTFGNTMNERKSSNANALRCLPAHSTPNCYSIQNKYKLR